VHKECDIIQTGALTKLQEAWDSSEQKDECIVCLDDLERAYWMGTEIGQLGGYGFQGVALGVTGRAKMEGWGPGAASSGRKERIDVREWAERTSSNRPELGGVVLHYRQQLLAKTPSYCVITKQCCVLSRNGWDKEEKHR
jgi:hypothetical protein